MGFHDRMRNMVIRQLSSTGRGKGVPVSLHRYTPGTFDALTGELVGGGTVTYPGSGVRVNYSDSSYNGVDIIYGDFQIYLSPVQIDMITEMPTPVINDTATFNGESVKIVRITPFNDNQTRCGWKLQVRYG